MVDVIHDFIRTCCTMRSNKVILDPHNEVIFECTFDHLMEKIRRKELMNVRSGKSLVNGYQKKS